MSSPNVGDVKDIYCNRCKGETHHRLEAIRPRDYAEMLDPPFNTQMFCERIEYRFWICLGCDTATLEEAYTSDAMWDPKLLDQVWELHLHPKRAAADLPQKRYRQLSEKLAAIYHEVIESYNNGLNILCTIGLRALLEGVCVDKSVSGRNLDAKIRNLKDILPENIVECLHSYRFTGNYAAHELQAIGTSELRSAIDVMEDLLNFLYELEYKASKLPKEQSEGSGAKLTQTFPCESNDRACRRQSLS